MGVVLDELGFLGKLEGGGGFSRSQVEKLTGAFYDAVVESVATKRDVGDVRTEIKDVRSEMKEVRSEIREVRSELRADVAQLRVWMAGTAVFIVSVLSALKFFG